MDQSQPEPKQSIIKEFRDFALRGNVVDLAVAVVIGAASAAVVRSLVSNLIMPLIAALIGTPNFASLTFRIGDSVIRYGAVIDSIINLFVVLAAVFFLVVKPSERISRLVGDDSSDGPDEVELLAEIRDLLKARGGS
jgi:large conductance mechanosensitive channel